jgi:hypothetical protein
MAGCNFAVAVASVVILQRAARRARDRSARHLAERLKNFKASVEAMRGRKEEHDFAQAEQLLDEIRRLQGGAFASLWENPVVGAVLLPSGGTALIELINFFQK